MRRNAVSAALLAIAFAAAGLFAPAAPALARAQSQDAKAKTEIFDEAWRIARDKFYDRKLNGLDWEAVGNKHRAEYAAAKTDAERSAAINALLAELGASHTHYYTKDEPAYYELADIFAGALRRELPKQFPGNKITYPGIGIFTKTIDGKTFVSGVFPGLPGRRQGRPPARR